LDSLGRRPCFLCNSAGTVYLTCTKKLGFPFSPYKQLSAKFLGMVFFLESAIILHLVPTDILLYSCRRCVKLEHGSKAALSVRDVHF
jgi:hypothetical protein